MSAWQQTCHAALPIAGNYFCPRELLFDSDSLDFLTVDEGDDPNPGQSAALQVKQTRDEHGKCHANL